MSQQGPINDLINAVGSQPWRSREELYKSAYSKPIKTQGFAQGSPGEFEEFSYDPVGEPNRRAAMDGLTQLLQTERGNDSFERERIQGIRGQQDEALTQGFASPVDQALYGRRIAEEKMRQLIQQQRIIEQGNIDKTLLEGHNQINVARLNDEGYTQRAKSAEDFQRWLLQNSPANTPVSGYTAPGRYGQGGGMRFDTNPTAAAQVPAATKRLVADAWYNYKQNPNMMTESAYLMTAGQALEGALASGAIGSKTVEAVREIMRDKNRRDLPFETLVQDFESYDAENPEISRPLDPNDPVDALDLAQLQRALLLIKGL